MKQLERRMLKSGQDGEDRFGRQRRGNEIQQMCHGKEKGVSRGTRYAWQPGTCTRVALHNASPGPDAGSQVARQNWG